MNIGIVVPYFTPYGNEYGLAQSLTGLGHNVTIITSRARSPREKMLTKLTNAETDEYSFNVEYIPTVIDFGDNPVTTGTADIRNQELLMLQEDYPFICHKIFSAAKKYDVRTILSSERTYYPDNIAKQWILKILDATTNKRLREKVDVITAHCTVAKEFMIKELGVRREITVIPVGVDTKLFRPISPEGKYLYQGSFKILTVARLHRYKGLGYLIEAMKSIRKEIPDAHLYILGKGPEEGNLKNLVKKMQLNSSVTFLTKSIPNYDMPKLYAECDVYVQPSIVEPFGIAVLEAMGCGKPVVGTDVGGIRDTIKDRKTGYLVQAKNSTEFADRIIRITANKNFSIKMGSIARNRAVKLFDLNIIGSMYMELLNDCI